MTSASHDTPASLGFRMPAEWEPHEATWIAWPHNRSDWPGRFAPIPWVYAEIIRNLARGETVHLLVQDVAEETRARSVLTKASALSERVQFHRWPTNRVWTRDYGPIFIKRNTDVVPAAIGRKGRAHFGSNLSLINFAFNAWAKYPDWKLDNQIPTRVSKLLGVQQF